MASVYGIGNPLIDLIFEVSDSDLEYLGLSKGIMHLVQEEKRNLILKFLEGRPFVDAPGGDCPNTMVNLAMLGGDTIFSGKVGNDAWGKLYEERLRSGKVRSDLHFEEGITGSSIILVTPDGERTMNTFLGLCQNYSERNVNRELLASAGILYFTGYMWDTQPQKDAISLAVSIAEAMGKFIVFDLADPFAVKRYRDDFSWLLDHHVDLVFANAEEARLMCDFPDLRDSAMALAARTGLAVVKNGSEGCIIASGKQCRTVPAWLVNEVKDTTGAGDSFAAGFLYGLMKHVDFGSGSQIDVEDIGEEVLLDAGRIACFLASQIITQTGSQLQSNKVAGVRSAIESGKYH